MAVKQVYTIPRTNYLEACMCVMRCEWSLT
jgi:hypothetical protein